MAGRGVPYKPPCRPAGRPPKCAPPNAGGIPVTRAVRSPGGMSLTSRSVRRKVLQGAGSDDVLMVRTLQRLMTGKPFLSAALKAGENWASWSSSYKTLLANDTFSEKWVMYRRESLQIELVSSGDLVSKTPISPICFIRQQSLTSRGVLILSAGTLPRSTFLSLASLLFLCAFSSSSPLQV